MISVIVPAYNAQTTLARCVRSIEAQTLTDWELLLIDDGSTDETGALCDELAAQNARLHVIHQKNAGVGCARNTGLEAARGEYIAFVDSDDLLSPTALERLLRLCREADCPMAAGGYVTADTNGQPLSAPQAGQPVEYLAETAYFDRLYSPLSILYVVPWGKLYHCSLFDGLRYPPLRLCDDEALIHRLAHRAGRIAVCYDTVYFYTLSSQSLMRRSGFSADLYDQLAALWLRADFFEQKRFFPQLFLTHKRLAECVEADFALLGHAPAAAADRRKLRAEYRRILRAARRNPAVSRRWLAAKTVRGLLLP